LERVLCRVGGAEAVQSLQAGTSEPELVLEATDKISVSCAPMAVLRPNVGRFVGQSKVL